MLDLVNILKNCPKGIKLYSTVHGEVTLEDVVESGTDYPIKTDHPWGKAEFARNGKYYNGYYGECVLFPSKDQRDWSKFKVPVEKFDYNTLQPFDKVLVRDENDCHWRCGFFSFMYNNEMFCECRWIQGIPYNDETKHLVGTTDKPDEKYIWWE